jgi:uncharacterized surface protein with fasciclin (FAS1) repeats
VIRKVVGTLFVVGLGLVAPACGGGEAADPPDVPGATGSGEAASANVPGPAGGVLSVLAADDRFSTLYRILTEDAEEHFVGYMTYVDWNHTVFAPTDQAFDDLGAAVLAKLLAGPPRTLTRVLDCHILPELVPEDDLRPGEVQPIQCEWPVVRGPEGVRVGPARIVEADIEASNGIVHAVDTVLFAP